jgi:hypothetical protein
MYPSRELEQLAQRKRLLQARIAVRRWECALAATELAKPVGYIDRGIEAWHRIAPFAKLLGIPLGIFLTRVASRRRQGKPTGRSKFGALMTALPLILRGAKVVMAMRNAHAASGAAAAQRSA